MQISPAIKDPFELLSFLVVIIGLPIAVYQYLRSKRYETYHALDEKYLDFLKLCLDNPQLDIFDVRDKNTGDEKVQERKREQIAFTMLFSIFERAHVMYRRKWKWFGNKQWAGWQTYIDDFCVRENFRAAWKISGDTFDPAFQTYMKGRMEKAVESGDEPGSKTSKRTLLRCRPHFFGRGYSITIRRISPGSARNSTVAS